MKMTIFSALSFTLLLLALVHSGSCFFDEDENPNITVSHGVLIGQKIVKITGTYYHFVGIPYAKPPLGELRFKAPVPMEPWNGTHDATLERQMCLHPDTLESVDGYIMGDEDCLYINVYIPQLPNPDDLLPVLVYIHRGGFLTGNGNFAKQGPQYILQKGVIYVSFNYRLGILGFLSTEDEVVPGNAGMKDQVQALRWVQENIASFGGDPDKVTIFGDSTGGAAVDYHMLSPMTEGLFSGAIAMSGSPAGSWAVALNARDNAFHLGAAFGYTGNSSEELVEHLRGIEGHILVEMGRKSFPDWSKYRILPMVYFVPSVEPVVEGETQYLPDLPVNLFNQGKFKDLPFMTGVTSAEGLYFYYASGVSRGLRTLEDMEENFNKTFKPDLRYCRDEDCGEEMLTEIREFYFGGQPINSDTLPNLIDFLSDLYVTDAVIYGAEKLASRNTAPVYFYHFAYDGELGFMKKEIGLQEFSGVCHSDDLGYIFDVGLKPSTPTPSDVREKTVTLWTNFVKYGNPTPEEIPGVPTWLPYTNSSSNYLEIKSKMTMKTNLYDDRYAFWQDLYRPYADIEEEEEEEYYICLGNC